MIPTPRSPAGDEPAPDREPAAADVAGMSLPDLRRQRRLLMGELRGVRYWRRIAQAQTDLLVAGLVYHGRTDLAGTPAAGDGGAPAPAGRAVVPAGERLGLLRERSRLMATYEHTLRDDLDTITRELAARLTDAASLTSPGHPA